MVDIIDGGLNVRGVFTPAEMRASGVVSDDAIEAAAGVQASKLQHAQRPMYEQESATTAFAETRVVHVVRGQNGTLQDIQAGHYQPSIITQASH